CSAYALYLSLHDALPILEPRQPDGARGAVVVEGQPRGAGRAVETGGPGVQQLELPGAQLSSLDLARRGGRRITHVRLARVVRVLGPVRVLGVGRCWRRLLCSLASASARSEERRGGEGGRSQGR